MRTHNSQSCLITTSLSDLADKNKSWDCSHCPCSPSSNKIKRHLALNPPRPWKIIDQHPCLWPRTSTRGLSFQPSDSPLCLGCDGKSAVGQFMVSLWCCFPWGFPHFQVGRGSFWMMFGTGTPQVQSWELCFRGHLAMLQHFRSQLPVSGLKLGKIMPQLYIALWKNHETPT